MRVANIVLAYRDPSHVDRLIKSLSHPGFDFYIHLDRKSPFYQFSYLSRNPRTFFLDKRVSWIWGSYSFVRAVMHAFDQVIESGIEYEFVNLLSNNDYPLKPAREIYAFLRSNQGKSFIRYEKYPSPWWEHAIGRINRYHLTDFSFRGKTRIEEILNTFTDNRSFPFPFELYGGPSASYWTMSMNAVHYLVKFFKENEKEIRFFRYTWAPDEFLFTTILMNSPLKQTMVNNNLRYIDWKEGRSNPTILLTKDFEKMKQSDSLFARKFDMHVDEFILDQLDLYIQNRTGELV
jgi:hypothetical protein